MEAARAKVIDVTSCGRARAWRLESGWALGQAFKMARRARAVRHTKGRDKDQRAWTKTARLASDGRRRRAERPGAGWPSGFGF